VLLLPGVRGAPLVLFTPGFLLNSALYRATASRLASWGWAVGLWDLNEVLDDTLTTVYMSEVATHPNCMQGTPAAVSVVMPHFCMCQALCQVMTWCLLPSPSTLCTPRP
jgi:hypothetical protein